MAKKGIGWIIAGGAAAISGATITAVSKALFRYTVDSQAGWSYGGNKKKDSTDPMAKHADRLAAAKDWYYTQEMEDVWITSSIDDTKLHARYFPCEEPKRFIVCVHGYRANAAKNFAGSAQWFHENGSTMLFVDERCCGKSEGRYITFGAREKYDVMDWADWLNKRNPDKLPLYLYGVSMGATAVLSASEYVLPDNLAGIIADCGFTSMLDICALCLKKWYGLPAFPLMQTMDLLCREEAHFRMEEADAEKALRKCKVPVLFLHGTEDDFVPPSHTIRNYHACAAPGKDIVWIEGAGHTEGWCRDTEKYKEAVTRLFANCEGA